MSDLLSFGFMEVFVIVFISEKLKFLIISYLTKIDIFSEIFIYIIYIHLKETSFITFKPTFIKYIEQIKRL